MFLRELTVFACACFAIITAPPESNCDGTSPTKCSGLCDHCTADGRCLECCHSHMMLPACVACERGYYGSLSNCKPCSARCNGGQCSGFSGRCDGCPSGYHGDQCTSPCSSLNSRCTQCSQGGTCTACTGNFRTPACTECNSGYYGGQCTARCTSLISRCTQCTWLGMCTACSGHFSIPACTDCSQGYYRQGGGCQQCSSGCNDRQCDRATGRCNACRDGWYGELCKDACSPGCARCDQDFGSCTICAVNSNLMSPGCTECEDGYYKQSASSCIPCPGTCDNNTPCDKTTGHCDECPPGKKGDTCNQACDGGQYGPSRCSLSCGQCEDGHRCHLVTGHCHRCQPGVYPPLCDERCVNKTYGENCSETCGQCKGGQPCDTVTGGCSTGCEPGYTGQLCQTHCQAGLYGEGCSSVCGYCWVNTTCHHQHGHCLKGCGPGFAEPFCLKVKPDSKIDSLVVSVVGSVIGAAVIVIGVVCAVCWYRRSRGGPAAERDRKSNVTELERTHGDKGTDSSDNQPPSSPPTEEGTEYYEISDTANTHEMQEMENNYDQLHPYFNEDADRQPYSQITSYPSDATTSPANDDYVDTAC